MTLDKGSCFLNKNKNIDNDSNFKLCFSQVFSHVFHQWNLKQPKLSPSPNYTPSDFF